MMPEAFDHRLELMTNGEGEGEGEGGFDWQRTLVSMTSASPPRLSDVAECTRTACDWSWSGQFGCIMRSQERCMARGMSRCSREYMMPSARARNDGCAVG